MNEGTRVRLRRDVDRYPHFVAPQGAEGTVTKNGDDFLAVKLDEPLDGAEEWDNEVQWYEGMFTDADYRDVFRKDVEVIDE